MAPIPAYLSALILLGCLLLPVVATVAAAIAGRRIGEPGVAPITGAFFVLWLYAALVLCIGGAFSPGAPQLWPGHSNTAPLTGAALAMALIAFLGVRPFREVLNAIPHHWIVAAQVGRLMGFIVLSLGLMGFVPIAFAGPAGWGDGLTGLAAPFVAYALYRRWRFAVLAAWIWNLFGFADLMNVTLLAAQSVPGTPMYRPEMGDNSIFALLPLGLLQVVYGPLFVLLHIFSMRALIREHFGARRVVAPAT